MQESKGDDLASKADGMEVAVSGEIGAGGHLGKIYQKGSLSYTAAGLVSLFFWLLWGDFCYVMLETIVPRLLPLMLKDLGASNKLIGIMLGTVPAIVGIFIIPPFCVMSDRYRSRWGRRRPFLMATIPFATGLLMLVGLSPGIGHWLGNKLLLYAMRVSETGVILATMCAFIVLFHLFNSCMSAMYNCLVADVVPSEVMGRFMALFRAVGTMAGFLFNRYIFGTNETHRQAIFLGIGFIYLVTFLMMSIHVKEGQYPPPEERKDGMGVLEGVRRYFRQCFSVPLYVYFFCVSVFIGLTSCMVPFYMIFYKQDLHMSMDEIGKFLGWMYLATAISSLLIGWVCDKIHPVRLLAISVFFMIVCAVLSFFFVQGKVSLTVLWVVLAPAPAGYNISMQAAGVLLLPKEKYGQYTSAMGIVTALAAGIGNIVAGTLFDAIHFYRILYLWYTACEALAFVAAIAVWIQWKKHGGAEHFVVPEME